MVGASWCGIYSPGLVPCAAILGRVVMRYGNSTHALDASAPVRSEDVDPPATASPQAAGTGLEAHRSGCEEPGNRGEVTSSGAEVRTRTNARRVQTIGSCVVCSMISENPLAACR